MALQTVTLDFEVQGALDGTTPAPVVDITSDARGIADPDNQIYPVVIPGNLGLVDPDYSGSSGSRGDRFLQRIEIRSPNAPSPAGVFAVVDTRNILGPVVELERVDDISTATYYRDLCVFVPQGAAIQLGGFPVDPGGQPHHVRLHFVGASALLEEAHLARACCCEENFVADQTQVCVPITITQLNPDNVGTGNPAAVFSVLGGPFTSTDEVQVLATVGGGITDIVTGVAFVSASQLDVTINTVGAVGGNVPVVVFRENMRSCFAVTSISLIGG